MTEKSYNFRRSNDLAVTRFACNWEQKISLQGGLFLEQTTREYRPVLQNFAYELTMVKGLIIDQTGITQEIKEEIGETRKQLNQMEKRLDRVETRLDRIEEQLTQILTLLKPSNG